MNKGCYTLKRRALLKNILTVIIAVCMVLGTLPLPQSAAAVSGDDHLEYVFAADAADGESAAVTVTWDDNPYGEKYYSDAYTVLQDYIDNVLKEGDTVRLGSDIKLSNTLSVKGRESIVFDLAGHTLSTAEDVAKGIDFYNSNAEFIDTAGGGRIVCNSGYTGETETDGLFLGRSNVELNGVSLECSNMYGIVLAMDEDGSSAFTADKGTEIVQKGGMAAIAVEQGNTLNIADCSIKSGAVTAIMACGGSFTEITGGTAETFDKGYYTVFGSDCTVNIGGTAKLESSTGVALFGCDKTKFNIAGDASLKGGGTYTIFGDNCDIVITGGSITNTVGDGAAIAVYDLIYELKADKANKVYYNCVPGKVNISGGSIKGVLPVGIDNQLSLNELSLSVSGGDFESTKMKDKDYYFPSFLFGYKSAEKFITGGTFNVMPPDWQIADGYKAAEEGGLYTVVRNEGSGSDNNNEGSGGDNNNDNTAETAAEPEESGAEPEGLSLREPAVVMSEECGDRLTYELSEDGTLTVSGIGEMYDFNVGERSLAPWFKYADKIKKIIIKDGVEGIGSYAFKSCSNVKTVSIPSSVKRIGNNAFTGCAALEEITVPSSVTEIGEGAFSNCSSLKNAEINAKVNELPAGIFEGCRKLETVTPDDGIAVIGKKAFSGCINLNNITLPENLQVIGEWAFENCEALAGIIIPASLTDIGDAAFWKCSSLKEISLPSALNTLGDCAFYSCGALKSAEIAGNSIERINDWAFAECASLEEISISSGVREIGLAAFYGCDALGKVTMADTVTRMNPYVFYGCAALEDVTLSKALEALSRGTFYDCRSLKNVVIPSSVKAIEGLVFADCISLESVEIPSGVNTIGETVFMDCGELKKITIPENVKNIEDFTFAFCDRLESVTIPKGVEHIGEYAFTDCNSLKDVYYAGTANQWELIKTEIGNEVLDTAKMHYSGSSGSGRSGGGGGSSGGTGSNTSHKPSGTGNTSNNTADPSEPANNSGSEVSRVKFADVPADAYYADAVDWAVDNGIATGKAETEFAPNESCTRAQMVTFLWRAAGCPEPESAVNPFTDVDMNMYYGKAVLWAVEEEITNGISEAEFGPDAAVSRAQTVTFMFREGGQTGERKDTGFADVDKDAYYADAVGWALANSITNGISDTEFGTDQDCTRAQIVTLLYRYYNL